MKISDSGMERLPDCVRLYAIADEVLEYGDMERVMESHGLDTSEWMHPAITGIRDNGFEWRTEWECTREIADENLQSGDDCSCGQRGGEQV